MSTIQTKLLICGGALLIIVAAYISGYIGGSTQMDNEWKVRILSSPIRYDTIKSIIYKELPPHTDTVFVKIKNPSPKPVFEKIECDSLCVDSLRHSIWTLQQPVEATCEYDSIGSVKISYFAVEGSFQCNWSLLPQKEIRTTVIETKTVIEPRGWWEIPTAILIGGITTYGIIELTH